MLGIASDLIQRINVSLGYLGIIIVFVVMLLFLFRLLRIKKIKKKLNKDGEDLYYAFSKVHSVKRYWKYLDKYIKNQDNFLFLKKVAKAYRSRKIIGKNVLELFNENSLIEIVGDPDWYVRFFSIQSLLASKEPKVIRLMLESLEDPYPLIRKTIIRELNIHDIDNKDDIKSKFVDYLKSLFINDPVYEVRKVAKERYDKEVEENKIDFNNLSLIGKYHVIELLNDDSELNRNMALDALKSEDEELQMVGADLLTSFGYFNKILLEVDFSDMEYYDHVRTYLLRAAEVGRAEFLDKIIDISNPASLTICSDIVTIQKLDHYSARVFDKFIQLYDLGVERNILQIMKESVYQMVKKAENIELYTLLGKVLVENKDDNDLIKELLNILPMELASYIFKSLKKLFYLPNIEYREELTTYMKNLSKDIVLPIVDDVISSGREKYNHQIRRAALKILISLGSKACIQRILEHLPVFDIKESQEYIKSLKEYDREFLIERIKSLLNTYDGTIRASILSTLPLLEDSDLDIKSILKESYSDSSPEVRSASVKSACVIGDNKLIKDAIELLRDPIEQVRVDTSLYLSEYGKNDVYKELDKILNNENEVVVVKESIVKGFGISKNTESINYLVQLINKGIVDNQLIKENLVKKEDKNEIQQLIENFKDVDEDIKDFLVEVFIDLGETGEEAFIRLLYEDIESLKDTIINLLDRTGYIAILIKRLNNKDVKIRRKVAEDLSLIGTQSAFKGMILASRDPDEKVRLSVIKALEKLMLDEGNEILENLKNDPDKKIRKYTAWAIERVKAKEMD